MIDLHTHSTASDGTTPPEQLVREAADAGLTVLALTDHDTTAGWQRAAEALPGGLGLVRGAELSCTRGGISLHLLAYLFDPEHDPLRTRLAEVRVSREQRAERMAEKLAEAGHPIRWEDISRHAGGTVGRPHVARALIEAGLVATMEEAFTPEWIGARGRYWAPKDELDALEAIALVRDAGGVTVFAHPAAAARGRVVGDDVVAEMAEAGLDGIEVDHPDHPPATREHVRGLAGELGLVTTGSSDFHGDHKEVRLGENTTAREQYDALVARASGLEVIGA